MSDIGSKIAPMHRWVSGWMPADVEAALQRLRFADDVHHVAVMPDVHLAKQFCIGTVIATERLLFPDAVGGDIGCGMAALAFDASASEFAGHETISQRVLHHLREIVPASRHSAHRAIAAFPADLDPRDLSSRDLSRTAERTGRMQLGTLGGGNHFLELQADEDNRLWLMIHSGSRGIGQAVREQVMPIALRTNGSLLAINAETDAGEAYVNDMNWARRYAAANRQLMVLATAELLRRKAGIEAIDRSYLDIDHNHVQREIHFERAFWVHRKGAMSARRGERGVTPGSMATVSYHVEGRGCANALHSSAHGAGRAMSRQEARQRISPEKLEATMKDRGVRHHRRRVHNLVDEAPDAYKNIGAVMKAQRELTRVVRTLRPIVSYKGA